MGRPKKRAHTPPQDVLLPKKERKQSTTLDQTEQMDTNREASSSLSSSSGSVSGDSDTSDEKSILSGSKPEELQPPLPRARIPPFIVQPEDWKIIAPEIMPKFNSEQLTAKFNNNCFHLQSANIEVFRVIQRFLSGNKISYHTFSLPSERKLKIVLRGIPNYYSDNEVKSELENLGFEINHIRQFQKEGRKLPMFMVILPNSPDSKKIFDLQTMFYITIKVEPYKNTNPAQCFSCQRFGHSSLHCGHPPRCVKCAEEHSAKDCNKTPTQDPKCSNCHGNHTANFKKCPTLLQLLSEKTPSRFNSTTTHTKTSSPTEFPPISDLNNTNNQPTPSNKPSYSAMTSNTPKNNSIIFHSIAKVLNDLLTSITEDEINTKDALIKTILAIMPILLKNHE